MRNPSQWFTSYTLSPITLWSCSLVSLGKTKKINYSAAGLDFWNIIQFAIQLILSVISITSLEISSWFEFFIQFIQVGSYTQVVLISGTATRFGVCINIWETFLRNQKIDAIYFLIKGKILDLIWYLKRHARKFIWIFYQFHVLQCLNSWISVF